MTTLSKSYKFVYRFASHNFSCSLKCKQCTSITKKGTRCKRKTCIGAGVCYTHLLHSMKLRIRDSEHLSSGKGVFAQLSRNTPSTSLRATRRPIVFRRGDTIVEYGGEIIDLAVVHTRYGGHLAPYVLEKPKGQRHIEDGACQRGVGSIINDFRSTSGTNAQNNTNVMFVFSNSQKKFIVKATKNIHDGEELLVNYGNQYFSIGGQNMYGRGVSVKFQ